MLTIEICSGHMISYNFHKQEAILKFAKNEDLCKTTSCNGRNDPRVHRNICVILGCLAEKLAGG